MTCPHCSNPTTRPGWCESCDIEDQLGQGAAETHPINSQETAMETLADALPAEQSRVRELLAIYESIPTGAFGAAMIRRALARAEQAAVSGDVVAMIQAYEDLKSYES